MASKPREANISAATLTEKANQIYRQNPYSLGHHKIPSTAWGSSKILIIQSVAELIPLKKLPLLNSGITFCLIIREAMASVT